MSLFQTNNGPPLNSHSLLPLSYSLTYHIRQHLLSPNHHLKIYIKGNILAHDMVKYLSFYPKTKIYPHPYTKTIIS